MLRKHIVIVGSGWAGMRLARELQSIDTHRVRITLVSDIDYFRYSAALYRVATGRRERAAIIPLSEILEDLPNIEFIKAKVTHIDRAKKILKTNTKLEISYDYAVLALGVITTYFGIPGLEHWSYSIKTSKELKLLRTHLHQELMDENAPDKNYVVIGGGPTGVELSAALMSYMKEVVRKHGLRRRRITIDLVEAAPRLLPMSDPMTSKKTLARLRKLGVRVMLNKKVESQDGEYLVVSGVKIPTHTVIWTAGVSNNPFFQNNANQFAFGQRGRVLVDDHLRVDDHLYVIGDNADTPYSGLGLTAVHNARFVGKDIKRRLTGKKPVCYRPLTPVTVVPVGNRWAIFQYRKLIFGGVTAAIIRSLADLVSYTDIVGPTKAFRLWIRTDEREEICMLCKASLDAQAHHSAALPHRS